MQGPWLVLSLQPFLYSLALALDLTCYLARDFEDSTLLVWTPWSWLVHEMVCRVPWKMVTFSSSLKLVSEYTYTNKTERLKSSSTIYKVRCSSLEKIHVSSKLFSKKTSKFYVRQKWLIEVHVLSIGRSCLIRRNIVSILRKANVSINKT